LESLRQGLKDNDKISIFEVQAKTYRLLQQALVSQKKFDKALEVSERSRARAFVELLEKRLSPNQADALKPSFPSIEQIKHLSKTRYATLVQYSIIQSQFNDRDKQENNSLELYIWVVKPTGEVSFRKSLFVLPEQQTNLSITTLITNSRNGIGVGNRATLIAAHTKETRRKAAEQQASILRHLHKLLIDPIADLLPNDPTDRVIFIPQGSLFLVPFPALQDANGKYLIETHTILTAPSIQVLAQTHQLQQKRQSHPATATLVVGNPSMPIVTPYPGEPPQQLKALPGAEKEAQAIAPLLHTKALTGTKATKATITPKMANARIIHLATHGLLDDLRGLGSAIALAPDHPGTPNDGLLTAEEILDMKLSADLVVLSACDTGRGRITGDGVIGLSRSFISAGVPSIIVSLWAVPDAPTAKLMTEFYTNWQVKKLNKAQALRQAMLTIMKTHPNPTDWAAFTLIGEAE
jgi:CHAT domain-containing protein